VPVKPRTIITPEHFGSIYSALPDADAQLLVETEIESGLRWGELTELRVRDLDFGSRILTVSRAVVEVHPRFHPDGGRFLIKEYPKDREYRRFKLSVQIVAKLPLRILPGRLCPLPGSAVGRGQGRPARPALPRHRRPPAHPPRGRRDRT